jgi:hypothetical protein
MIDLTGHETFLSVCFSNKSGATQAAAALGRGCEVYAATGLED